MSTKPEFDSHRDAIRARGHSVNPYRIGLEVGRRNEDLPCPYAPGSRGARLYADGVKYGRQWAIEDRKRAAAAIGKDTP